jgi:Tol biopolymer transport system component
MTYHDDLDRQLTAWLDDPASPPAPRYLPEVLERTRRTRQRPAWASLERWLPMAVITRPAPSPSVRLAFLLLIGLLMLALVASVAIVGSRLSTSTTEEDRPSTAMIPQGPEAVYAFASEGDVFTVRADGSELRQLTDDPGVASYPTWSPDGTRIAYHEWLDGADSLVVMDAGGGDRITLATDPQAGPDCSGYFYRPVWAPDGSSLLFPTRDGCDGGFDLATVPADGSASATRLLAPGMNSLLGTWSPDGTRLAYLASEGNGSTGLYVADVTSAAALAGDVQGRLIAPDLGPDLLTVAFEDEFSAPRWSPDGSELAVAAIPGGGFFLVDADGIYIVEADGSGQRLLAERAGDPTWSPDGQQVAFLRTVDPSEYVNDRPCTVRTWIVDADGTDERELPTTLGDGCGTPPQWSPDGTRLAGHLIVYTPDAPPDSPVGIPFHLGFVMADGSSEPVVLQDGYGSWQPVVAPLPGARAGEPSSPTLPSASAVAFAPGPGSPSSVELAPASLEGSGSPGGADGAPAQVDQAGRDRCPSGYAWSGAARCHEG